MPSYEENSQMAVWEENIKLHLRKQVDDWPVGDNAQRQRGRDAADAYAKAYVKGVQKFAIANLGLKDHSEIMFGRSGSSTGWIGNWWGWFEGRAVKCRDWTTAMAQELLIAPDLPRNSGWKLKAHTDIWKAGDPLLALMFKHSVVSLTWDPGNGDVNPSYVLDPWKTGRPHIYHFSDFNEAWPLKTYGFETSDTLEFGLARQ